MAEALVAAQMPTPDDAKEVQKTFRFAWAIAELRGRYRRGLSVGPATSGSTVERKDHALPLSEERSLIEQAIQVENVVIGLAGDLSLDFACAELLDARGCTSEKVSETVTILCQLLRRQTEETWTDNWDTFANLLFHWDAKIQDRLAQASFTQACAYQLGRGMAEAFLGTGFSYE